MFDYDFEAPIQDGDLQRPISNIIDSIAKEDASLSKILDMESGVLEGLKKGTTDMHLFVRVNESVSSVVKNISKLKLIMQYELENAENLLQKAEDLSDYDELEE